MAHLKILLVFEIWFDFESSKQHTTTYWDAFIFGVWKIGAAKRKACRKLETMWCSAPTRHIWKVLISLRGKTQVWGVSKSGAPKERLESLRLETERRCFQIQIYDFFNDLWYSAPFVLCRTPLMNLVMSLPKSAQKNRARFLSILRASPSRFLCCPWVQRMGQQPIYEKVVKSDSEHIQV